MTEWKQTALVRYLKGKNSEYFGKIGELRANVEDWLSYVSQMFPHYTRHTVKHSDEIVCQLSKLLFRDEENPRSHTVPFSATEVYILLAASYLHDIGMVVAPQDMRDIVASPEWHRWIMSDQRSSKKWDEINQLRQGSTPPNPAVRNLLADIHTRYLMAEYVRRGHHVRAATIMTEYESLLGGFAFNDPQLLRTISEVCVAHGLNRHQLEDNRRFPYRVDIRGEKVNVRFLALLLRIGDLLDMSVDRALPLLFRASSPLPSESLAHWTQYRRIMTRTTAWDKISLHAECMHQEEHRFLQDWCEWLVEEIRNAEVTIAHAERHQNWRPPIISIGDPNSTITIQRAPGATYKPVKWRIVLDHDAVLERLIKDVYTEPHAFVRELVQNAADANRCQLFLDMARKQSPIPEYPTQVAPSVREDFPIFVSLEVREETRELTGESESRQILIVEDCGIGMDTHIVQHYLLQIGRSYYTSDEFRRQFSFSPTSRFGVGFLSVFGASERVVIETLKEDSDGPLRLTLQGPKSYLLVEQGTRVSPGTRIEVWLDKDLSPGILSSALKKWCRRLEFPVIVNDLGKETVIRAESPQDFLLEVPAPEGSKYVIRAYPMDRPGLEGEIYIRSLVRPDGIESWDVGEMDISIQLNRLPLLGRTPSNLLCFHGIRIDIAEKPGYSRSFELNPTARLDIRSRQSSLGLSREQGLWPEWYSDETAISRLEEILRDHLAVAPMARGSDGWKYKQRLADHFYLDRFWSDLPEMVPAYVNGDKVLLSFGDLNGESVITIVGGRAYPLSDNSSRVILHANDFRSMCRSQKWRLPQHREGLNLSLGEGYWSVDLKREHDLLQRYRSFVPSSLPDDIVAASCGEFWLLNVDNPLGDWVNQVVQAGSADLHGINWRQSHALVSQFEQVINHVGHNEFKHLKELIENWRTHPSVESSIRPPSFDLEEASFLRLISH